METARIPTPNQEYLIGKIVCLKDIAPTMLKMLGLAPPKEITSESLL